MISDRWLHNFLCFFLLVILGALRLAIDFANIIIVVNFNFSTLMAVNWIFRVISQLIRYEFFFAHNNTFQPLIIRWFGLVRCSIFLFIIKTIFEFEWKYIFFYFYCCCWKSLWYMISWICTHVKLVNGLIFPNMFPAIWYIYVFVLYIRSLRK